MLVLEKLGFERAFRSFRVKIHGVLKLTVLCAISIFDIPILEGHNFNRVDHVTATAKVCHVTMVRHM